VISFQLKKKTLTMLEVVVLMLSLGTTVYILWRVEREESVTPTDSSAAEDYYQENQPIFEDICGDGFLIPEYGEECEFSDPGGYECEWDDSCNQNTCECETSQ